MMVSGGKSEMVVSKKGEIEEMSGREKWGDELR